MKEKNKQIPLTEWTRSLCKSAEYPAFDEPEPVTIPDTIAEQSRLFRVCVL